MTSHRLTQGLLGLIALLLMANLGYAILDTEHSPAEPAAVTAATPESPAIVPVLRARLIELVDQNGEARAQLYLGDDGTGNIRLRDGSGTVRVKIGATADGSGLLLLDADVEPAIRLGADRTGTSLTLSQRGKESTVIKP